MRVQTNLLRELESEFLSPVKNKKETSWKWGCLTLILGIIIGASLFSLYFYMKGNPQTSRLFGLGIKVSTVTVKGEVLTEIIGANGKTEPATTIEINTSVGGKVLQVPVAVGAFVLKDSVLAEIDPVPYKATFKEAEDQFIKARKNFNKSEAFEKQMQELFSRKLISSMNFEKATREHNAARTAFSDSAERLLIAQDNLKKTVITSKAPGIIMERNIKQDDIVHPKDTLFLLGITDAVRVAVVVPKEKGDIIVTGQQADIVLDSLPNTILMGEVEKIDPIKPTVSDEQMPSTDKPAPQQVKVFIQIKSESKIKAGLPAYAWIKNNRKGLMIPRFSIVSQDKNRSQSEGEASVFVVEDSKANLRTIRTGTIRKNKIEVLEGLTEGETVVSVGLSELQDNDRVIVKGSPE